jgi:glutathione S-transferase
METAMKLYYLKGACSLASYISLCEAGVKFEATAIDRATKKTADGEDFNSVNPKGYAPALRLDNGQVLTENVAVLQYIADLKPEAKLAPPNGTIERYRLVELLAYLNSEIHKNISPLFVPTAGDDVKNFARENLTRRLDWLNSNFGSGPFLTGSNFTVADAYLFVILGWFGHVGLDVAKWPNLQSFQQRVGARPAVDRALRAEGLK